MELIPISTTQNNQGDCKFFLLEIMLFELFENINCLGNDKNMLLHVAKVY